MRILIVGAHFASYIDYHCNGVLLTSAIMLWMNSSRCKIHFYKANTFNTPPANESVAVCLRRGLTEKGGQCVGVVSVTKEWDMDVTNLVLNNSSKQFNSLKTARRNRFRQMIIPFVMMILLNQNQSLAQNRKCYEY